MAGWLAGLYPDTNSYNKHLNTYVCMYVYYCRIFRYCLVYLYMYIHCTYNSKNTKDVASLAKKSGGEEWGRGGLGLMLMYIASNNRFVIRLPCNEPTTN